MLYTGTYIGLSLAVTGPAGHEQGLATMKPNQVARAARESLNMRGSRPRTSSMKTNENTTPAVSHTYCRGYQTPSTSTSIPCLYISISCQVPSSHLNSGYTRNRTPTMWSSRKYSSLAQEAAFRGRTQETAGEENLTAPDLRPVPGSASTSYNPARRVIVSHINSILDPINASLEPEIAEVALTHKSMVDSGRSHGEKLSFVGRRVLRLHLSTFLYSALSPSPLAAAQHLRTEVLDTILDSRELGAGVGKNWALEKAMRWREVRDQKGNPSGLYTCRGAAVEALVGAVFLRHGIVASNKMFHKLVLPLLSLPRSLAITLDKIGAVPDDGAIGDEVVKEPKETEEEPKRASA